jgi:isopenicillin N synthase-like dioxygenase
MERVDSLPVVSVRDPHAALLIDEACRSFGFFALADHELSAARRLALISAAGDFFALPAATKETIAMRHGGVAWRGWFPLGGEFTSGVADAKEGLYFGREEPAGDVVLHGPNLWPEAPTELRREVEWWMQEAEALGQRVLSLMATGLGLAPTYFTDTLTTDPTVLFRIFRYPPARTGDHGWGVGEHTDYGLLTLLAHDGTPGLEVKVGDRWIAAPSDPDLVICNLGDMLERLTEGRYRSTSHRVRNSAAHDRYSLPFFLDPSWSATVSPISIDDGWSPPAERTARWDEKDLSTIDGRYGEWITAKVSRVFPELARSAHIEET